MCSITAHDMQKPTYVYDTNSAGGISIPKNETAA